MNTADASPVTKLDQAVINEYLKVQKIFSEQTCKPSTEQTYSELDLNYRGDGNFIPLTLDQKVDIKSVKSNLVYLKDKISWIKTQKDLLEKEESLSNVSSILKRVENEVSLLQEAKKDYFLAKSKEKKIVIEQKSKLQFSQMLKELENLKNEGSFLLSFKFPLNHLSMRAEYEKFKKQTLKESRIKANTIYLFRKIVQDGSFDEGFSRNDSVIRAAFDTLYLSLNKEKERVFLTENERADFKFILANFKILIESGKDVFSARMKEWHERTERSLAFYQDLADGKKIKLNEEVNLKDISTIIEDRAKSLLKLKEFVLKKEAEAYEYWSSKSELFQFLYVMETILYAEVGRIDAPDALERRDVGKVVMNRFNHSKYNQLGLEDAILNYLPKEQNTNNTKWLNVLFKEGEFSFTYFYIPGNLHIYCPDMSKVGHFLRRENARIALELYNNPKKEFSGLRYFSRMSMFGRIEMDSLWDDYAAIGELPGKPVKNPKKLAELYKQDRFKFLYHFDVPSLKKVYIAVEIKGRNYVIDQSDPKQIFYYRNPHQFRYFSPLK